MRSLLFILLIVPLLANAQTPDDRRRPDARGRGQLRVGVLTSAYQPFSRIRSDCDGVEPNTDNEECRGNSRFEGYCVDLLNAIREQLPGMPDYVLVPSQDDVYGTRQPNGSFDGMIGMIQRREIDLACTPMVVNDERSQVVEFSQPIMSTGIGIMMKRQGSDESCFSTLFRPFTCWTWFFIFLTFLLLLLARFLLLLWKKKVRESHSPRHTPRDHSPRDHNPRDHSPERNHQSYQQRQALIDLIKNIRRVLKYLLYAFTIAVLIFYFANLVSHLVARRAQRNSVRNVDDLLSRSDLRYGMVRNGNTHQFFQRSTLPSYVQLLRNIESQSPSGFVSNYSEGVRRVRESNGDFAFLLESSANDYATRQDCTTFRAGNNLQPVDYALEMPTGSPWREQINGALRRLQDRGELTNFQNKWWNEAGQECPSEEDSYRLGWSDLCWLFLLLPLLLLLGILFSLIKFFMDRRRPQGKRRQSLVIQGTETKDQRRLHSPVVRNQETTTAHGHFNENFETPSHVEVGVRNDGPDGHRVINHPIHVVGGDLARPVRPH